MSRFQKVNTIYQQAIVTTRITVHHNYGNCETLAMKFQYIKDNNSIPVYSNSYFNHMILVT